MEQEEFLIPKSLKDELVTFFSSPNFNWPKEYLKNLAQELKNLDTAPRVCETKGNENHPCSGF